LDVEWFLNARFGMFIHYGLYSLLARGERVWNRKWRTDGNNTRSRSVCNGMRVSIGMCPMPGRWMLFTGCERMENYA